MKTITILYFTGYGHTAKVADSVARGANSVQEIKTTIILIDKEGNITEDQWNILDASSAIIFGSPTYMGGPAWQIKKIAETSSGRWFKRAWQDKIAAGFTNSASMNGDKSATLSYFTTLALQHGMAWVGSNVLSANSKAAQRNDINYLGSFSGLMAQSPSDSSPDEGPLPGDLETARLFGIRVAEFTKKIIG